MTATPSIVAGAMARRMYMQRLGTPFLPIRQATTRSLPENLSSTTHGALGTLWLRHPTLSDTGLRPGESFASLQGDPSLRETALSRRKYVSCIDRKIGQILGTCERLLTSTDCYSIYIGFNSSEVRTESIFHPFSYEIHDAESLVERDYLSTHFTQIPFEEKMKSIIWVQNRIDEGPMQRYKSGTQEYRSWAHENVVRRALAPSALCDIVHAIGRLRDLDDYYLRNAAISLSQGIVRATFNCDGTYVIPLAGFSDFVSRYFDVFD